MGLRAAVTVPPSRLVDLRKKDLSWTRTTKSKPRACFDAAPLQWVLTILMCSLLAARPFTVAEGRLEQQKQHAYTGRYERTSISSRSSAPAPVPALAPASKTNNGTFSSNWNSTSSAPAPRTNAVSPFLNASSPAPAVEYNGTYSNSSSPAPAPEYNGTYSNASSPAPAPNYNNTYSNSSSPAPAPAIRASLVPALFIFGDSLVDVGNNNYIGSLARADFYPNGIDFPGRNATGRFCNGKTVLDYISEFVGLPYPPPFMAPTTNGAKLLQGVNYASGAAGILDSTGSLYVQRIPMSQQIQNFESNTVQLYFLTGGSSQNLSKFLNEALYAVVIGANDYINNYLQPNSPTKNFYTPQAYQKYVLETLSTHLQRMHDLGARKVVVTNVGPLGCIPEQISLVTTDKLGRCIRGINDLVENFNVGLRSLLSDLNLRYQGNATFLYGDVYSYVLQMVSAPRLEGFKVGNAGCCGMGRFNAQFPCLPSANVCRRRSNYVFWDAFHPTQAANHMLASMLWTGGPNEIFPTNVQQLVAE